MLKARFIDKILEALTDEVRKLKIFGNTFLVYFYEIENKDKNVQEKRLIEEREILDVLMQLKFNKTFNKYELDEIVICYELNNIKIKYKTGEAITENLGMYGIKSIWTIINEILEANNEI
ncbi:MAG: hypothetical protein ACTTJX_04520 [Fusobacterium sp.]|uniref:hypothetical protein n=1 Tax=Fusobacterium sp. TaxID=68766 RepID=UPI003F9EE9E5